MNTKKFYMLFVLVIAFAANTVAQNENWIDQISEDNTQELGEPKGIVVRDELNTETSTPVKISRFILKESGIHGIENKNTTLEVIPVSATSNIQINIKNEIEEYYIIELFDNTGSSIYHKTIKSNFIQKKVDLSPFPKGNYTLKISSQFGNVVKYYSIEQL